MDDEDEDEDEDEADVEVEAIEECEVETEDSMLSDNVERIVADASRSYSTSKERGLSALVEPREDTMIPDLRSRQDEV